MVAECGDGATPEAEPGPEHPGPDRAALFTEKGGGRSHTRQLVLLLESDGELVEAFSRGLGQGAGDLGPVPNHAGKAVRRSNDVDDLGERDMKSFP